MKLVKKYGLLWARNKQNFRMLRKEKLSGIYVLCDGSMPVYIGRGRFYKRMARHIRSEKRAQFWDHFSWFAMAHPKFEADIEALLLMMLPFYLRSLNRLRNNFSNAKEIKQIDSVAEVIEHPHFAVKRKQK